MCDKIPFIKLAIHNTESEIERLSRLLEKCKERTHKKYKCYLISDQINDKNGILKSLKESLETNIQLCNMYQQLDNDTKKNK